MCSNWSVIGEIIAAIDGQDMKGILTSSVSGAIIGFGVGLLAGTALTASTTGIVSKNAAADYVAGADEVAGCADG
jgi:hypothetical protein